MKKVISVLALSVLLLPFVATAASYPVGGTQYYLSGAGINSTQSTIQLTSFKTSDGRNITMANFGSIGYAALDPQTTTKLEDITFTGVTQNSNGTATLTGVTRGIDFITPYTATPSLGKSHAGGATFILTNTASYYGQQFALVNNPSVVTDYWTFPTPLSSSNPATKGYVDGIVSGGTITSDKVSVVGTAGETVVAGNILYLKTADARWWKASTAIPEASSTIIGISQGSASAGATISNGVLLFGSDTTQTGLSSGANYFLGNTAGTLTTATTTVELGKARSSTNLYFEPHFLAPSVGGANTFTGNNTFTGVNSFTATTTTIGSFPVWQIGKQMQVFSSTGTTTFAVPSGITKVAVEVLGAGGGGNVVGGGSGAWSYENVDVTGTSTIQVFVGSGGAGANGAAASNGAWSTFGTNGFYLSAGGGSGASGTTIVNSTPGGGGAASTGDINVAGGDGFYGSHGTTDFPGHGGVSHYGSTYGDGGGGVVSGTGAAGRQGLVIVRW